MDMSAFVVPKSDQLNADDLIAGPRTIRVSRVTGTGNADQPVAVYFDGDGNKPYKPCKSMRRVMIAAWGADASQYVGRSMTIHRDPKVAFGGMEVGGIRISHMSHIEREMQMALTVTKAKRAPYRVLPLKAQPAPPAQVDPAEAAANDLVARINAAPDLAALEKLTGDPRAIERRAKLADQRPELAKLVNDALAAALATLTADDDFPGTAEA